MKLAEALILRADIRKRMAQWNDRVRTSVSVQEGEQPTEAPEALFTEWNAMVEEFTSLSVRINQANITVTLPNGISIMEAIAQRDALTLRANGLNTAIGFATAVQPRYGRAEIKTVATVDVAALRRDMADLMRQRRELDVQIQAANWAAEMDEG
ncbi:MAG: DIP1984 family protein [Anaerolineae bacterium]|nr:DIP1984 family protein [Anaerolineae bacterium]